MSDNFRYRVQERLRKIGKTQEDLADYLEMKPPNLSRLLREDPPKQEVMVKIAQFLGIDISLINTGSQKSALTQSQTEPDYQSEIKSLREIIKAKDEIIKSKDEIIAILKANK